AKCKGRLHNLQRSRLKSAVARTFVKTGSGKITINGEDPEKYFPNKYLLIDLKRPLDLTGMTGRFDINITVNGGGYSAQENAARLGISRALTLVNADFRKCRISKKRKRVWQIIWYR
uniref:30S ribosomal protein S9 n=1 Tax=Junco hyemalis TaxID=40217 RepID=A0A8C5ICG2_JUNHY